MRLEETVNRHARKQKKIIEDKTRKMSNSKEAYPGHGQRALSSVSQRASAQAMAALGQSPLDRVRFSTTDSTPATTAAVTTTAFSRNYFPLAREAIVTSLVVIHTKVLSRMLRTTRES
jgi:hypothetical protein